MLFKIIIFILGMNISMKRIRYKPVEKGNNDIILLCRARMDMHG